MQCRDFRAAWLAGRYEGLALQEAAQEHLTACAGCRAFVAENAAVDQVLAFDTNEPPGPGFDTRFFARLAEAKAASRVLPWWRRPRLWAETGAVCAALLLAGILWPRGMQPVDVALALELDVLQEDPDMLARLDDVQDFVMLEHAPDGPLEIP